MAAQAKAPVSRKRALSAAPPASFEACVVTYISQDRAFQRVFAEADIEGMKKVVREKLNLAPNAGVRLAQVAEGRRIDLEDDADFYAFQLGTRLKPELQVEVSVIAAPAAQLASPSVTATSINLERAPPPSTQTGKGETSQATDGSTSVPPAPKKKKKPRKSNLIIIDNEAEQRSNKPTGPAESTANEQVPKAPKSKAKEADPVPPTTNAEPAKKPKSKAKSVPPADQPVPAIPGESKQPNDITTQASNVPPKSKKGKKAATGTTPAPEPIPVPTTESIPEPSPTDTEIPQSRPKKRGRKAAQDGERQDIPAPETTKTAEPPVKKQRTSVDTDVDMGNGAQSPVATTLPPPIRSERRGSTVLSIPNPDKPVSSVGSAADILRRWGAKSAATQVASGDGPSTTTDVADQDAETKFKPKRKRKKKDQAADNTSTTTSIPAPTPEATQCLVCTSGPHEPSDCPVLSKRDSETAKMIEERIQNLEETQGPARIHQMLIGTLRRWLKDTKKQVEAQNVSITPTPVPTPIPTRPKKSKLSSVAVSQQSEGSSTEDEDILKSVMESRIESDEEDGGEDGEEDEDEDEEMADTSLPKLELEPELQQATNPVHTPTPTPPPKPTSIPLPPSSPTTKVLLQSQRMSQSGVRALLDGLESEEAGDGEEENSDEEGSDLAQSTPSDVARRRHRKTVRLDVQDSDEEATIRAQAQAQDEGSDVEMRDSEERDLATLSQLLDSSQHIPEEIVGMVGEENDEDDIEEYEDEKDNGDREVPDGEAGSPIESPDREPVAAEEEVAETGQEEESEPPQEDEDEDEDESEPEVKPAQESETVAPAPKKRGRPPLSQSVKDARAAEKARIQAEKVVLQGGDPSVPRKRGRPRKSQPVEGDTSTSGKPESVAPATQTPGGPQEPRPRGRPRLSDSVRAEREAAKERVRAEKTVQRLEQRTAKANKKTGSKGKNATTPTADHEEGEEKDEDSTVRRSSHAEEATEPPVAPAWSTLKNPSSSRPGSSQADEIEWSATEAGEDGTNKRPSGLQPSASKPTPDTRAKKGSAPSKPLFMPSSGLGQRFLPALSPFTSTPIPSKLLTLSQQTPSNALQRRRSIGSASAPRFTEIRKTHDLQQRSRKERNKSLSSQPTALNSSQSLKSKPNGADGVVDIESSDEEVDSSADEAKKLGPSSQRKRKRPSAFAYFDQP